MHTRAGHPAPTRHGCAVIMPTLSGGLWDLTGLPWIVFAVLAACAVAQTLLGVALSRYHTATR